MTTIVGTTGSPNTIEDVSFDVRAGHLNTPLHGTLVAFNVRVRVDDATEDTYLILGQVTKVETINRWHEEAAFKNFIKLRGALPHLTTVGDITEGNIQIIGAYRMTPNGYKKARISVPPGSGIDVTLVEANQVLDLLQNESGYAFIGKFYGSNNVPAPIYLRHFGDSVDGGSGEAYMGGVFGPSGSGKTVMAMTIASLWTAASPKMGFLFLDPQSEFAENKIGGATGFSFDLHALLTRFSGGRFDPNKDIVHLNEIQLEGDYLFAKMLDSCGFIEKIGIKQGQKRKEAIYALEDLFENVRMSKAWSPDKDFATSMAVMIGDDTLEQLISQSLGNIYSGAKNKKEKADEFAVALTTNRRALEKAWNKVAELFSPTTASGKPKLKLTTLVDGPLTRGEIKILDLNPDKIDFDEDYKFTLMNLVFKKLGQYAHMYFKSGSKKANCMIVLDEAGRFIPQIPDDDEERQELVKDIVAKVKMLRKYQVGFMFITQTVAEIQKEIYRNLHYRVYGVGLGVGSDQEHIISREGQAAFNLYKTLPDPRQSGTFSYMVSGILPVLGSTGRPMFIEGYGSDSEIIAANDRLLSKNGSFAASNATGSLAPTYTANVDPFDEDFNILE